MKLKVLLPTHILLETVVDKITAEAEDGYFTLLHNHVDFATALSPGILSYFPANGGEKFLATDRGTLVKCGDDVFISANRALMGNKLETLQQKIEREFLKIDDDMIAAKTALSRLELGIIRRFMDLK